MADGQLAILGGRPALGEPLHVGRPFFRNQRAVIARIDEVLRSRRVSNNGPAVRELEQRLSLHLGVRHVVATANGTLALQLALEALGLSGEVILPSFTFVATAHAVAWQRLTPVFCDVDPATHNIDPAAVEGLITPRTSAILAVHLWGRPCAIDELTAMARAHGLRLLFDAAHAFGCSHRGTMIGNFGDLEVFSFHATKCLSTIEGGAVATNDAGLADRVRALRRFGLDSGGTVSGPGTNATMNEICAAVGLSSLGAFEATVEVNRRRHALYGRELRLAPGISVVSFDSLERHNHQFVVVDVGPEAPLRRDEVMTVLRAENVLARPYFAPPCHELPPYRGLAGTDGRLRHTDALSRRLLCLPTGPAVTSQQVRVVCAIIKTALAEAEAVRSAIHAASGPEAASVHCR